MAYCRRCGTELRPGARFCTGCGDSVDATPSRPPQTPGGTRRWWLFALVVVLAGALLAGGALIVGPMLGDRPGTAGGDGAPDAAGDEGDDSGLAPDRGWAIAYVTEDGIETRHEDGTVEHVSCVVGQAADWSPDRRHVAMVTFGRADMAYENGVALVSYPAGELVYPFWEEWTQIEYGGWRPDSSAFGWGDFNDYYEVVAETGHESVVVEPVGRGWPAPTPIAEDVAVRIDGALAAAIEPPLDPDTAFSSFTAWASPDGSLLLLDVAVWRDIAGETANFRRETSVWMANADGTGLVLLADGHSPVWIAQ